MTGDTMLLVDTRHAGAWTGEFTPSGPTDKERADIEALVTDRKPYRPQYAVVVLCDTAQEHERLFYDLKARGLNVRLVSV